jgi:hypothetical protein
MTEEPNKTARRTDKYSEAVQWIVVILVMNQIDRMPIDLAIRFLTQIATDKSWAEREFARLKEREEEDRLNIIIDDADFD